MENIPSGGDTRTGTAGGILLVVLLQLQTGELLKTALLAGIGAAVSYSVSVGMKWIFRRLRKR